MRSCGPGSSPGFDDVVAIDHLDLGGGVRDRAGVRAGLRRGQLVGRGAGGLVDDPVTTGVAVGLVVGKTVGVFLASALAVRLGVGRQPAGTTWTHVLGLAMVAGIAPFLVPDGYQIPCVALCAVAS